MTQVVLFDINNNINEMRLQMKILYVTTISNTVNAFLIPHIKMLVEEGHEVDVAFNIVSEVSPEIFENGCKVYNVPFQRYPLSTDNFRAYTALKKIITDEKYDIVHTHTPVASVITRLVCKNLKDVKVFYTAHGFHFYKGAPLLNWIIYYPIEKWLSKYTDVLITINKEDYVLAQKSFYAGKVEYVPGVGLDIDKINSVRVDRKLKRKEIGVPEDCFLLLSVGELNKNKNHGIVIKALAQINDTNIHYVICGQGKLHKYLLELCRKLKVEERVHLLGYRRDVIEICKASDLFVFPSLREGLSVSLMEAMASGLPVICSDIRGNKDLIEEGKGGYLINSKNVLQISNMVNILYSNFHLRVTLGVYNTKLIKCYDIKNLVSFSKNMCKK